MSPANPNTTTSGAPLAASAMANAKPAVAGSPTGPNATDATITSRPVGVPPLGLREDTTHHASLFIGDLSAEVNDATLRAAFAKFPSLSECRVMYDPNTGRSRGYGFASFGDGEDAQRALSSLNGEWLGSRPLRINWANQKNHNRSTALNAWEATGVPLTYEQILAASPPHNTTVYVGNLHPMTTQPDIVALFQHFSYVREVRLQGERGYGFAVLDTHEAAANAILQLSNTTMHGRVLRVSWGKDRADRSGSATSAAVTANMGVAGMPGMYNGMVYGVQAPGGAVQYANYGMPSNGFTSLPSAAAHQSAGVGVGPAMHNVFGAGLGAGPGGLPGTPGASSPGFGTPMHGAIGQVPLPPQHHHHHQQQSSLGFTQSFGANGGVPPYPAGNYGAVPMVPVSVNDHRGQYAM